jgi:hypothetical protein
VTKVGKGLIANREGARQIGAGLIIDFAAQTYRQTSASGGEEPEASMAGQAAAAGGDVAVPDFWDEAGVYALLRAAVEDPSGQWAAMTKFTQALRDEQARLLHEEAPRVPIPPYVPERELWLWAWTAAAAAAAVCVCVCVCGWVCASRRFARRLGRLFVSTHHHHPPILPPTNQWTRAPRASTWGRATPRGGGTGRGRAC